MFIWLRYPVCRVPKNDELPRKCIVGGRCLLRRVCSRVRKKASAHLSVWFSSFPDHSESANLAAMQFRTRSCKNICSHIITRWFEFQISTLPRGIRGVPLKRIRVWAPWNEHPDSVLAKNCRQTKSFRRPYTSERLFFFSKFQSLITPCSCLYSVSCGCPCMHTDTFSSVFHSQQALNDTSHPDASHRVFGTFACEGIPPLIPLGQSNATWFFLPAYRRQISWKSFLLPLDKLCEWCYNNMRYYCTAI